MITIPSRATCLDLLRRLEMPPNIFRHSLMVTGVSLLLGRHLNGTGNRLDLQTLEAGALLHDVAKERSLRTGEPHDRLGAELLLEMGYPAAVADIVGDHVTLDSGCLSGRLSESLIVNYSDKRVKHDRIVTIQERFADLIDRYAKSPEHMSSLLGRCDLYLELERKIFAHLHINPADYEIVNLAVPDDHSYFLAP
mgnify:FL=1